MILSIVLCLQSIVQCLQISHLILLKTSLQEVSHLVLLNQRLQFSDLVLLKSRLRLLSPTRLEFPIFMLIDKTICIPLVFRISMPSKMLLLLMPICPAFQISTFNEKSLRLGFLISTTCGMLIHTLRILNSRRIETPNAGNSSFVTSGSLGRLYDIIEFRLGVFVSLFDIVEVSLD